MNEQSAAHHRLNEDTLAEQRVLKVEQVSIHLYENINNPVIPQLTPPQME